MGSDPSNSIDLSVLRTPPIILAMPIYAYKCASCGHTLDVMQKISDARLTVCTACGQSTFAKQLTAAGFQLKGSGWYATDFKNAEAKKDAPKTDEKIDGKTEDKAETKTDGNTETKTEVKAEKSDTKSDTKSDASGAGNKSPESNPIPSPARDSAASS